MTAYNLYVCFYLVKMTLRLYLKVKRKLTKTKRHFLSCLSQLPTTLPFNKSLSVYLTQLESFISTMPEYGHYPFSPSWYPPNIISCGVTARQRLGHHICHLVHHIQQSESLIRVNH